MASEKQYDFFKSVYDEEQRRYTALAERAKVYQAIITLYVGALTLKADEVLKFVAEFHVPIWLPLVTTLLFLLALALTVLATRIRTYEGIADLNAVIMAFGTAPPKDEDFWDDRLTNLAVATTRNSAQNNRVANLLLGTSWLIFAGLAVQVAAVGWALTSATLGGGR